MDQNGNMEQWVSAYLEWTEVQIVEPMAVARRIFSERRTADRRAGGLSPSREDVLLLALRAESECVHMLRQVLDSRVH